MSTRPTTDRRGFLRGASALGAGFAGLRAASSSTAAPGLRARPRFGPLRPDPDGLLDLPEGFSYTPISPTGEIMSDGLPVPPRHDGMGAFARPDGKTVLVRNHEMSVGRGGAYGDSDELPASLDASRIYDPGIPGMRPLGGTTTLVYDTAAKALVSSHLSLAGTAINCAGGVTPWGSWLSCEEIFDSGEEYLQARHGYVFEVPALGEGLAEPVPLVGMGRFVHEAVAVHEPSGAVYLTEDMHRSLLYRFLPNVPGRLAEGGKLQALRIRGADSVDTRNWNRFTHIEVGEPLEVSWIDLDDVDCDQNDLRLRGFADGAARFARGEGIWMGDGEMFFTCTSGGRRRAGQIWRYVPSEHEGAEEERRSPGTLELFYESDDAAVLEMCDNLTLAPWGDVIVSEDGPGPDRVLGVTREGEVYEIARNALNDSEICGPCFSPDGSTLFFNIQTPGVTVAVTGPWPR